MMEGEMVFLQAWVSVLSTIQTSPWFLYKLWFHYSFFLDLQSLVRPRFNPKLGCWGTES